MSLINEALKKAQRQRNEEQAELTAPMPGGGSRLSKRTPALSTQSMMLVAAGGIALFVVCVVVTVIWINRPTPGPRAPAKPAIAKTRAELSPSIPIIVPLAGRAQTAEPIAEASPVATAPKLVTNLTPAPVPVTMSSARSAPTSDLATSSRSDASAAAPRELAPSFARPADIQPPAPMTAAGKFDERMQTLVDGFRVSGIRASGSGSKVLLNEKVYKVNDIVDRTNGLRLTQVARDRLTFATPDGVTYVKNF
jgi:hypothetical protein